VSIVSIASAKGGVGKTTLALNLGYAMAQRGWRTLVVDTDPQSGLGLSVAGADRPSRGFNDVVMGESSVEDCLLRTRLSELTLLPFGRSAPGETGELANALADGARLRDLFGRLTDHCVLLIVDTPAGLGGITTGVLRASSHLVAPVQAEPMALRSLTPLLELIATLREEGCLLELAAIVATMVQTRVEWSLSSTQEIYRLLPSAVALEAVVPRDPVFLEASAKGAPLGLLRHRPPAVAAVFGVIAAELEQRLGLTEDGDDDEPIPLLG